MSSKFGEILAKIMEENHCSRAELARKYDTSSVFIHYLVKGERTVSPNTCDRLAKLFELSDLERQQLHRAAALDRGYYI